MGREYVLTTYAPSPFHLSVALDGAGWHPAAWRTGRARADVKDRLATYGRSPDQLLKAAALVVGRRPGRRWYSRRAQRIADSRRTYCGGTGSQ